MKSELESVIQTIQSARSQVRDLKKNYAPAPEQVDLLEDVELALGWALQKLDKLKNV